MTKFDYDSEADKLALAIDIAIQAFKMHPPDGFDEKQLAHFVNVYEEYKTEILSPEKRFRNKSGLKQSTYEVFTYFQEGHGNTVNVFWDKINESKLDFRRENRLAKILKRKKIKDHTEYDFVIDTLVPYQQEGLISSDEVELLNSLISDYETNKN
ncbi:hypothetical protein D3C80_206150 [compost metagenome]